MLKLIGLELRKLRMMGWLRNALIADFIIALWCVGNNGGNVEGFLSFEQAFGEIGMYVRTTFVIFASVLMSRMIIDEYRNKTITVLYTYPVPRSRLLLAKLAVIGAFTLAAVVVSNALVDAVLLIREANMHLIPEPPTSRMWTDVAVNTAISAASAVGMSWIPLLLGMHRKSPPATIVTSFIVTMISMGLSGNGVGTNWTKGILLALVWLAAGAVMANMAIRNAEREDLT
jgi:hypothetical protein